MSTAKTAAMWSVPSEPGPEVTAVRDDDGNLWTRTPSRTWYSTERAMVTSWRGLVVEFGPLTDATQS